MMPRAALLAKLLLVVGCFLALHFLFSLLALSSFAKIEIEARFDHADMFRAYHTVKGPFTKQNSARTPDYQAGERLKAQIDMKNHVIRRLRVDPGEQVGKVDVYVIRLLSFFGPAIVLNPVQIGQQFTANNDIASMRVVGDRLELIVTGPDPQLLYKGHPQVDHMGIAWFLPAIATLAIVLLLGGADWRAFPAFRDIRTKTAAMGTNIDALDGVRGVAALAVLVEHSGYKGPGALGVLLFFALSGFLLATPFVHQPARAISPEYMVTYLRRRLKRILPMFYVVVTVLFLLRGKVAEAFRHYVFLQGDGILWTVMQEMFFYLVLPVVMLLVFLCCRERRGLAILLLLAIILSANRWLTVKVIALYGFGALLPARVGVFLGGVLFAYIYYWVVSRPSSDRTSATIRQLTSVLGLLLLAGLLVSSFLPAAQLQGWHVITRPNTFGLLAGLLLLLVVLAPRTWLTRIVGWYPLRAVGLVGYSFYLLHPLMITVVRAVAEDFFANPHLSGPPLFLYAGVATYLLAIFTYTYIERPFIRGGAS